jgi:nucleotide-binding universal stress UspA family protein
MKSLVVPVDFSPAALNAANYALDFALAIHAGIILVYVYQVPVAVSEAPVAAVTTKEVIEDAEKKMEEWKEDLVRKSGGQVNVYTEIKEGVVSTQVEGFCNLVKPYAVVMGSNGSNAINRIFFGSNTLSAIRSLSWPLIVVPQGARFKSIHKVGLACDLKNVNESVHAAVIRKLLTDFNSELHILYVNTGAENKPGHEEADGSGWLRDVFNALKPQFHYLNRPNIEEGVNEFAERNNLDMLIVIPKKHGLLASVFHKSEAKHIALRAHVPLLSIHA